MLQQKALKIVIQRLECSARERYNKNNNEYQDFINIAAFSSAPKPILSQA